MEFQGALASSSVAMSAGRRLSWVARMRLSTWATLVALAMGAVTPGRAISQAKATSPGWARCWAATSSRAASTRRPRGVR